MPRMRRADEHERLRLLLDDYIAGALDERERREIETHLETCAECRATAEELRTVRAALRALPEVEAPRSFRLTPEMVAAPKAPVPIRPRQPAWIPRFAQIAAAVAALGFASVLAIDIFGSAGDEDQVITPVSLLSEEAAPAATDAAAAGAAESADAEITNSQFQGSPEVDATGGEADPSSRSEGQPDDGSDRASDSTSSLPPDVTMMPMAADSDDGPDNQKRLLRSLEAVFACAAVGFVVLAFFARPRTKS